MHTYVWEILKILKHSKDFNMEEEITTHRNLYDILSFPSQWIIDNNNLQKRNA